MQSPNKQTVGRPGATFVGPVDWRDGADRHILAVDGQGSGNNEGFGRMLVCFGRMLVCFEGRFGRK